VCLVMSAIYCVLHLCYQVLVNVISVIMMEYTIPCREICYIVNTLGYSLLCFIDQTPNTSLNIYSSCLCFHPLNHNHDKKEAFMCHPVTVFLHAHFNPL
jgi:hypothetical protein